ncbi:hypothetical protein TCARB_1858 [Thermofilum adornatum 1505]|uniref:Uncharacterized protein n=1 Tax=Thermofilum adornatum 1505 TaxID=697581 RepID=A0A3G1AA99_9CREN|nr:hypothetical protein TCARB_1858 [Thermofilum adornatum 1505]
MQEKLRNVTLSNNPHNLHLVLHQHSRQAPTKHPRNTPNLRRARHNRQRVRHHVRSGKHRRPGILTNKRPQNIIIKNRPQVLGPLLVQHRQLAKPLLPHKPGNLQQRHRRQNIHNRATHNLTRRQLLLHKLLKRLINPNKSRHPRINLPRLNPSNQALTHTSPLSQLRLGKTSTNPQQPKLLRRRNGHTKKQLTTSIFNIYGGDDS